MKCVFVESAHKFVVQYHSPQAVRAANGKDWRVDAYDVGETFRLFRPVMEDDGIAIFVPAELPDWRARQLLHDFANNHPHLLPADAVPSAWERMRARLSREPSSG